MNDELKKEFLGGFELVGQRQHNGKLVSYLGDSKLNEWPEEVEMCGNVYTLEGVKKGKNGYESAMYA